METITYRALSERLSAMKLFNKAPELDPEMLYEGLENGTLWASPEDEENGEIKDIFQWYLIDQSDAEYIMRNSEELIFYSLVLDEYLWAITHYGTSWDGVTLEFGQKVKQGVIS